MAVRSDRVQKQRDEAHSQGVCQQELGSDAGKLLVLVMSDSWEQGFGLGTVSELVAGISRGSISEEVR